MSQTCFGLFCPTQYFKSLDDSSVFVTMGVVYMDETMDHCCYHCGPGSLLPLEKIWKKSGNFFKDCLMLLQAVLSRPVVVVVVVFVCLFVLAFGNKSCNCLVLPVVQCSSNKATCTHGADFSNSWNQSVLPST